MSFDRLAPHYRWMEAVLAGRWLHRCRTRWLAEVKEARRALLVGEGPGRMLEACVPALPRCEFTILDRSEAMLAQARRRWASVGDGRRATFRPADLRQPAEFEGGFDPVVTHFFLDCFAPKELSQVITNLSAAAGRSARWLVSDFVLPPSGWRRCRARAVLALAYGFFRMMTDISARRLTAPDEDLRAAGFALTRRERFNHGLLQADLWTRTNPAST